MNEPHPLLAALLQELPPAGSAWPPAARDRWLETAKAILELLYPTDKRSGHGRETDTESFPGKAMRNAMWKILDDERKPIHYREIYDRLIASGFRVPGQDPVRNVNAHLSADTRFSNVGRGLWGLHSWQSVSAS